MHKSKEFSLCEALRFHPTSCTLKFARSLVPSLCWCCGSQADFADLVIGGMVWLPIRPRLVILHFLFFSLITPVSFFLSSLPRFCTFLWYGRPCGVVPSQVYCRLPLLWVCPCHSLCFFASVSYFGVMDPWGMVRGLFRQWKCNCVLAYLCSIWFLACWCCAPQRRRWCIRSEIPLTLEKIFTVSLVKFKAN
jgi:hypothetical protein